MNGLLKSSNWVAGVQWLFFIFTNIVIIPITVGAAFGLPQETIVMMLQMSFIVTGLACIIQAWIGHRRPLMEGQSGLWWGVILTLVNTAAAQGMPLQVLGGSLTLGIILSAVLTILIGITGLGPWIAKLFNSTVMGVFMFLLGAQLVGVFLQGMLGIPFGNVEHVMIDPAVSLLSIAIAALVIFVSIKAPASMQKYSLLIGIVIGWIAFELIFETESNYVQPSFLSFELFPLGSLTWETGIILTVILTGLLNTANTFGAIKGSDPIFHEEASKKQYRNSFTITGFVTGIAGIFGLVPYSPYVSSIGFLYQTGIFTRMPFMLGGFLFFMMGVIPAVGAFFSGLPLSVGSAVLFVSYLQLVGSSFNFFKDVKWNTMNIYRIAIPLFVGLIIMTMPATYFNSLPGVIRPLVSNGLIVGITLALLMENVFNWDQIGTGNEEKREKT